MLVLFNKAHTVPEQNGPLCYYFSLQIIMQMHQENSGKTIPDYCQNIANTIADKYSFFDHEDTTILFDDIVDEIFKENLTNEIIINLKLTDENGDLIETVGDFMDEYPHSYAMGLLLGFSLKPISEEPNIDDYIMHLKNLGPILVDGEFGMNNIDESLVTCLNENETIKINHVNPDRLQGQHAIVLIGIQKSAQNEVYYIDPNYPQLIMSMPFYVFLDKLINTSIGLLYKKMDAAIPYLEIKDQDTLQKPRINHNIILPKDIIVFEQENNNQRAWIDLGILLFPRKRKYEEMINPRKFEMVN